MTRTLRTGILCLLAMLVLGADAPLELTGQILAYQQGYVFFTTGDAFRLASNVTLLDDTTKRPSTDVPRPRLYARAVFDDTGTVTTLYLTHSPLPIEPLPPSLERFVVVSSPKVPNPELGGAPQQDAQGNAVTYSGKPVLVSITVQVPPSTPLTANIYIATDTSGWNPQAIQMDRLDALHFRVIRKLASGTVLHYLYTRGSLQSEELGKNGLAQPPRLRVIGDAATNTVSDTVYSWADTLSGGQNAQPNALPTPYNPAPFPNLPSGYPTPHPK